MEADLLLPTHCIFTWGIFTFTIFSRTHSSVDITLLARKSHPPSGSYLLNIVPLVSQDISSNGNNSNQYDWKQYVWQTNFRIWKLIKLVMKLVFHWSQLIKLFLLNLIGCQNRSCLISSKPYCSVYHPLPATCCLCCFVN